MRGDNTRLDDGSIADLRDQLDKLEREAPVVPQSIYDKIEAKYAHGVLFVETATDLYPSVDDGPSATPVSLRE